MTHLLRPRNTLRSSQDQQPKLALSEMKKLYPSWKVYQDGWAVTLR